MIEWWPAYLGVGAAVGFLAGLLGVGGGMITVPMLVFVFTDKAFPASHLMHLSLATAMATIPFTSASSVRAHRVRGGVDWRVVRGMLPGRLGLGVTGGVMSFLASFLAAGAAFMTVPFMTWCNVPLKRAIGTAAAIGFPLSLASSIGYVYAGWNVGGLQRGRLGFVYVPALALIAVTSILTAPLGARVSHHLPVRRLQAVFALLLFLLALHMLLSLW
jgi:uncharacterized membrane protein YfcA